MSYLRWSSSATERRNSRATGTRFDAPLFHHDAPNPNGRVKKFRSLLHFLFPVFDGQPEGGVCLCSSTAVKCAAGDKSASVGERRQLWVTARLADPLQ